MYFALFLSVCMPWRISLGLIRLSGTEKRMFVSENVISDNRGEYMMEIDITSHR